MLREWIFFFFNNWKFLPEHCKAMSLELNLVWLFLDIGGFTYLSVRDIKWEFRS